MSAAPAALEINQIGSEATERHATPEETEVLSELAYHEDSIELLEERAVECENMLKASMGDCERLIVDEYTRIEWKTLAPRMTTDWEMVARDLSLGNEELLMAAVNRHSTKAAESRPFIIITK